MASLAQFLPFLLIIAVFWFLVIRPQRNRQRELLQMQSSLVAGDEVMLTSGIFGVVRQTTDEHAWVEVADGVTLKVARGAIGQVVPTSTPGADEVAEPEES